MGIDENLKPIEKLQITNGTEEIDVMQLKFNSVLLSRYPEKDHEHGYPFPSGLSYFCMVRGSYLAKCSFMSHFYFIIFFQ